MKRIIVILVILFGLISSASAITVNEFSVNGDRVFEEGDEVEVYVNSTEAENASIEIFDPSGGTQESDSMLIEESTDDYQIFLYDYILEDLGGDWTVEINLSSDSSYLITSREFHVATDEPLFKDLFAEPRFVEINESSTIFANITHSQDNVENVTIEKNNSTQEMSLIEEFRNAGLYEAELVADEIGENSFTAEATDSDGRFNDAQGSFFAFEYSDETELIVDIAPTCTSNLDLFLTPGDGEIVQNKTGAFVQIASNQGNVESNISINYLDITQEGDSRWERGDPIGPVIQSFDGDFYPNIDIGESVFNVELFLANNEIGNYTSRSAITTECFTPGPQEVEEMKDDLEGEFDDCDTNQTEFTCSKIDAFSSQLVVTETTTETQNITSEETVDEQRDDTEAFEGEFTLNATDYTAYTFDGVANSGYDYACVSSNQSIDDEDSQCAYEGNTIQEYLIDVQEVKESNSTEASFAQLEENEDLLNTTKNCESLDEETALCNTSLSFFENFNFFENFEIVDSVGEDQGGVDEEGDEETNETIEGDQDDVPGETEVEVPEPEPEPEPQPEPEPEISLVLDALNDTVTVKQGEFAEATFNSSNFGNQPLQDVSLQPQPLFDDWDSEIAEITDLQPGDSTTREVFVRPSEDTPPGTYSVPVSAQLADGRELDLDYFNIEVEEAIFEPRVSIEEAPSNVRLEVGESETLPFLVENPTDVELEDVTARVQNIESCGQAEFNSVDMLEPRESTQISMSLQASDSPEECETTVIVSTSEGAYAFAPLTVTIIPEQALIPEESRVPIIAILWTLLLLGYAVATREYNLDDYTVKGPYIALVVGEVLLVLYLLSTFYTIEALAILPF